MTTRRRDKEETRELLLEAAYEMLLEQGLDVGWGIRVADVTARVGLTTGAAYQIWNGSRSRDGLGGQDRFHRDLARYTFERLLTDPVVGTRAEIDGMRGDGSSFEAMVQLTTAGARQIADPSHCALYLAVCSAASSVPELGEVGRAGYEQLTSAYTESLRKNMAQFGFEMVPPHTLEDLIISALALFDGLCLRQLIDPDSVRADLPAPPGVPDDAQGPWHIAAVGVLALIRGMTRPVGSTD